MLNNNFDKLQFYHPEVGLDEMKTAKEHYQDLKYYMQDENIPAIEKIQEICEMVLMPFEADMCKFAKESVQIDAEGKLPYNIADIKRDMAEALRDDGKYYNEIEVNDGNRHSDIQISASAEKNENMNRSEVCVMVSDRWADNGKDFESFGSSRVSFGEFKQMPPVNSGIHIEPLSFESFLNSIRFYADVYETEKSNVWTPVKNEKKKEKDLDFNR